jgi:colanic acid/amylovoran biosynthesis glycosyltransferase
MKKVIHFSRKLLPPTASFIYNQFTRHLEYEPAFLYCEDVDSAFKPEIEQNYPTLRLVEGKKAEFVYKTLRKLTPDGIQKAVDYLERFKPDVCHFHYGVDAMVFLPILKRMEVPSVVSFYGYDCTSFPKRFFGYGRQLLKKNIFEQDRFHYLTAMSPDMKKDLVGLGCPSEKIITHYHGINTSPFRMNRDYREKQVVKFLIISSLAEKKGHLFLLQAFKKASLENQLNLELHIVGKGKTEERLRKFISEHRLENVKMHPPVNFGSQEHLAHLKEADVFVHPSVVPPDGDKEGIPGALVEAMASGLPVISTYHAGIPAVVKQKSTGLLVKEFDTAELSSAIIRLAENVDLRRNLGQAGREEAISQLDIGIKQKDLENIYQMASGKAGKASNKVEAGLFLK